MRGQRWGNEGIVCVFVRRQWPQQHRREHSLVMTRDPWLLAWYPRKQTDDIENHERVFLEAGRRFHGAGWGQAKLRGFGALGLGTRLGQT